uniref:Uncharacterized protein n=1 Tax=Arundo donax TaxID=35708 RepID=A0A0A9EEX8_ARUDO
MVALLKFHLFEWLEYLLYLSFLEHCGEVLRLSACHTHILLKGACVTTRVYRISI